MSVRFAWCHAEGLGRGRDNNGEGGVFLFCHCAVIPSGIVKLGASLWFAAISDGCCSDADSERLGVKDSTLMEIGVFV